MLNTNILNQLAERLQVSATWVIEMQAWGRSVAKYRRYQAGEHDQRLSENMQKLLRLEPSYDARYMALNHMDVVIQTMVDRCILQTVEADNETASGWAQGVLDNNRYDALQADVHEAAIRDGDAFLMVSWDDAAQQIQLTFEDAWDGTSGIIPIYGSRRSTTMLCAVKIWQIDAKKDDQVVLRTRINIYWPDRVEKYVVDGYGELTPYVDEEAVQNWLDNSNQPLGVPIIHFRNAGRDNFGASELRNVIFAQDALNRFAYSAIIAAELTGYPIFRAIGFKAPKDITPGAIIEVGAEGLDNTSQVGFDMLPAGDLSQLLSMMDAAKQSISTISRTPAPEFIGADGNVSGEALKQKEIGLLGKVRRFQNRAGNSWEDTLALGWRIQKTYSRTAPPAYTRFYSRWMAAEIRNDSIIVDNALKLQSVVGDKQVLRLVAPVFDLDEAAINNILEERKQQAAERLRQLLPPRFSSGISAADLTS